MERQLSESLGNFHVSGNVLKRRLRKNFALCVNWEMPAAIAFDRITDFQRLEEKLPRYGMSARRIDPAEEPGVGLGWIMDFDHREGTEPVRLVVNQFDRPGRISISGLSRTLEILIEVTIIALNGSQSRAIIDFSIRPRDLRANLMLRLPKRWGGNAIPDLNTTTMRFINDLVNG
ncbi:hypothetical protein C9E81_06415 [Paracoccus alkanivorans]|uniref:SRPBCC family protein n=2 Tax=Paracoccus alkanivorans TaxID=2116655 RepID=A0A3M0MFG8_9RHOB|nr:hypothetical protein C9E81_06415 [Paracoccus alkanivorans]